MSECIPSLTFKSILVKISSFTPIPYLPEEDLSQQGNISDFKETALNLHYTDTRLVERVCKEHHAVRFTFTVSLVRCEIVSRSAAAPEAPYSVVTELLAGPASDTLIYIWNCMQTMCHDASECRFRRNLQYYFITTAG